MIGAGPTALGAADRLCELGIIRSDAQVIILEQESQPGGLAISERDEEGFLWDMGGHVVFSHYKYFTEVLDEAVPEWNQYVRAAYAFMKGSDGIRRFIPYPVQDNIHLMDEFDRQKSLVGLERLASNPGHEKLTNFDEWLLMNFGVGLCEIFMRKYNRKIWTVNSTEMNAVWVGERVAVPDVRKIKAKIAASESGREQEARDSEWGPNHLFRFPRYGGTGSIWKAVAKKLPQGWFHFQHKVTGVDVGRKTVKVASTKLASKEQSLKYDHLISTAPLDSFLGMIEDTDATSVQMKSLADDFVYTHTHIMGIGLKGQPPAILANKSWMYFPDSDAPFYRITVFSSYSDDHVPVPGSYWSLMCEAAEPLSGHSWTKETLLKETIAALVNYSFIAADQVVSRYYHRLDHGYPVPSLGREGHLSALQPWLQSNGIYSRGRFGGWRYEVSNQDHSLMQGVEVADLLMRGTAEETYPDPGRVNTMKGTERSLQCFPPPYSEVELVIAHYNENLDWLGPVADRCHIYHKGRDGLPQFRFRQWEHLPNVGREGHTYLHHIINNYDHLSDITVFLQGSLAGHRRFCYQNISTYITQAREMQFSSIIADTVSKWGRIRHVGKWRRELESRVIRRAKETFGDFWYSIFGYSHPRSVQIVFNGCFSVTRE